MADALGSLYQHGLAHVLQVSEFLSVCDFSRAHQPGDAYAILMEGLGFFNLPPMPSLAQHSARKRDLNTYVGPAQEFLNYSMFLDDSKRRKHLRNISEFRTRSGGVELDRSLLGDFAAAPDAESELLDALEDYIRNRSDQARRLLATLTSQHLRESAWIQGTQAKTSAEHANQVAYRIAAEASCTRYGLRSEFRKRPAKPFGIRGGYH